MTPPSAPTGPTDPTDPIEGRVRRALAAAAPADTDVDGGLDDLRARVDSGAAPVALDARRPRVRRWLAIAAAVVVVAGLAAAVVVAVGGDDGDERLATTPVQQATGWYVPSGLDGWELQRVESEDLDLDGIGAGCPCTARIWVDAGSTQAVRLDQFTGSATEVEDLLVNTAEADRIEGIALGDGLTGISGIGGNEGASEPRPEFDRFVAWYDDGVVSVVSGNGLSTRRVIDAAHAVARAGSIDAPPLPGFRPVESIDVAAKPATLHLVYVTMRNASSGRTVTYLLQPPGYDSVDPSVAPTVVDLPGTPGPLLRVRTGPDDAPTIWYLGNWPGSSVSTGPDTDLEEGPSTGTDAEVRTVLGSLRAATADQWAAFLDTAVEPVADRDRLAAPSFAELPAAPDAPSAGDVPTASTPTSAPPDPADSGDPGGDGGGALALQFRPVLAVKDCDATDWPVGLVLPDRTDDACYLVGDIAADGTDLRDAEASEQEGMWVVSVAARAGSPTDRLNGLFNTCYAGEVRCPPVDEGGPGAVAIVLDGVVISAPDVNGPDLASDRFTLSADFDQREAQELADAINGG